MKRVFISETDPVGAEAFELRRLSEPLGTTDIAINHYRVAPGAGLPAGLHAHADQEEVFVVLEGAATFETLDGEVDVATGEAIRFGPGEFQSGRNDGDEELVLLALGAPGESEDVRIPIECPECDGEDLRLDFGGSGLTFACRRCGAERTPIDCPECGGADLRVTLGADGEPVADCTDCGGTYERPPIEGEW
ncbi:cupin domain-containing protein [Halovivax sp.]|uniref:cupin domain-containing protein n=1 Tax=Halovivax sp. TaxID=1935978 RepID=UPI0025B8C16D|nr:cupin domain-containing protein [Halovivax sp.]